MKDIVIYGAGGYGREIACLIKRLNAVKKEWNLLGFIDDGEPVGVVEPLRVTDMVVVAGACHEYPVECRHYQKTAW